MHMAKYFVLGEAETDDLWLVDLENGTVAPFSDADLKASSAGDPDLIEAVKTARTHGITATKGVKIAIATNNRSASKSQSHIVDPIANNK